MFSSVVEEGKKKKKKLFRSLGLRDEKKCKQKQGKSIILLFCLLFYNQETGNKISNFLRATRLTLQFYLNSNKIKKKNLISFLKLQK